MGGKGGGRGGGRGHIQIIKTSLSKMTKIQQDVNKNREEMGREDSAHSSPC